MMMTTPHIPMIRISRQRTTMTMQLDGHRLRVPATAVTVARSSRTSPSEAHASHMTAEMFNQFNAVKRPRP